MVAMALILGYDAPNMSKDKSLAALVASMVLHYGGTKREFAQALGISPSAFSRLLADPLQHEPSAELCLELAKLGRVNAAIVLRAAGKERLATLCEELFGAAATHRLASIRHITPIEQTHLEQWRALDQQTRRSFMSIISLALQGDLAQRQQSAQRARPHAREFKARDSRARQA